MEAPVPARDSPAATVELPFADEKIDTVEEAVSRSMGLPAQKTSIPGRTLLSWVFSICACNALQAAQDSSNGPLLLPFEEWYHTSYTIISLIFVCACAGNLLASFTSMWLTSWLGYGKAVVFGASLQVMGNIAMVCRPPLPVFFIAYVFCGMSEATLFSQTQPFLGRIPTGDTAVYVASATYGFSGAITCIVATQFATPTHWRWHYFLLLAIAIVVLVSVSIAFQLQREEEIFARYNYSPASLQSGKEPATVGVLEKDVATEPAPPAALADRVPGPTTTQSRMATLLRLPSLYMFAIFFWVYVGAEITLAGWSVTFLIKDRAGGQSSGYVSTGIYIGLSLGRLAQIWIGKRVSDRIAIPLYAALSIALQLVAWLVHNYYVGAVTVCLVAMLMGPVAPIMYVRITRILPHELQVGALSIVFSLGNTGGAIFPWITGLLSQHFGVYMMNIVIIALMGSMAVFWELAYWANKRRGTVAWDGPTTSMR